RSAFQALFRGSRWVLRRPMEWTIERQPISAQVLNDSLEFWRFGWLNDVAVGAQFVCSHPILFVCRSSKNHDGNETRSRLTTDRTQDGKSIDFRQVEIKENQVGQDFETSLRKRSGA